MSEPTIIGFPQAAARLGVSLRVLRSAIRAGRLAAPAQNHATGIITAAWLAEAQAKAAASPQVLNRIFAQKTPAFARYPGTSAWRKYAVRVREYARFQKAQAEG